jgi:hypothetical protein
MKNVSFQSNYCCVCNEKKFTKGLIIRTINQVGEKIVHSFLNQHKPMSTYCKESTLLQLKKKLLLESVLN